MKYTIAILFILLGQYNILVLSQSCTENTVTTIAGDGSDSYVDGVGTNARFKTLAGAKVSSDGSFALLCDENADVVRHVSLATSVVSTLAGGSHSGYLDGTGTNARFDTPSALAISSDMSFALIADRTTNRVRKIIISTKLVSVLSGSGSAGVVDGTGTGAQHDRPQGIAISSDDVFALVVGDNDVLRHIVISTGVVTTVAGTTASGTSNGVGTNARFNDPYGVTLSPDDTYALIADTDNHRIRKVVLTSKVVTTIAGSSSGDLGGVGTNARFHQPHGIAIDPSGTYALITDTNNHKIKKIILTSSVVSTYAGSGTSTYADGSLLSASFDEPWGIGLSSGGLFALIADSKNRRLRMITIACPSPTSTPTASPTYAPSSIPTSFPTFTPTVSPTRIPTSAPTTAPTLSPTGCPTHTPTSIPTSVPTGKPSTFPTSAPSGQPTSCPSNVPTGEPSGLPTSPPSNTPTGEPSGQPTSYPTSEPTGEPSGQPTSYPTSVPTGEPSGLPTSLPSNTPTGEPSGQPTLSPTGVPTGEPSGLPTSYPSSTPTGKPSGQPTSLPSSVPTGEPSGQPTSYPTGEPTGEPSGLPTSLPSSIPTGEPSGQPTSYPTSEPTGEPSGQPTSLPSSIPTGEPSGQPTSYPTGVPTGEPSGQPTSYPTSVPSGEPSGLPTSLPSSVPTGEPSGQPTSYPTGEPTGEPSGQPTSYPTGVPTSEPSGQPTSYPTGEPTGEPSGQPTSYPSTVPTGEPSGQPTSYPTGEPTGEPSGLPTSLPSSVPTGEPSGQPTSYPTGEPTGEPSGLPTSLPSSVPTGEPSGQPTSYPTSVPTGEPSGQPTSYPTSVPSGEPSGQPTTCPTSVPTKQPSSLPTSFPTAVPTYRPSGLPTGDPSTQPTSYPTSIPTGQPSDSPTSQPSCVPTSYPTGVPSSSPSSFPSASPSHEPTSKPSSFPTALPTTIPSTQPTGLPSSIPSCLPSGEPTSFPSTSPSYEPSSEPSSKPTSQPSTAPTEIPSSQPSGCPSNAPSGNPTLLPTSVPSCEPSSYPSYIPSSVPSTLPTSIPSATPSQYPSAEIYWDLAPNILTMDVTISSEDSLKVDVTLSEDGIVYCAALSSTEYISQWSIRQNGFISHSQSGMASVSINGVPPGAQVHVYCATFSYNGDAMSEANIRSTLVRVNMPCCRRLEADVVSDYMPGAGEVTDVMTISLQSPPSQDVTVTVSAFYLGSNFTNTSDDRRLQTFNASSALTPSEIKYTANSSLSELEKTIMFVADVEGNYEFNITLSGSSGEEYAVTFPSGKNVHVLPVYHLPPAPIISYARFVSDGSLLLVKFTSPTNKGDLIDTSFSCDQVLSFSHASSASCSWENSYRLSISLGPLSTLTVGDIVSIQPNVITGRCIYADTTICSSLEHSPPSSTPVTSAVTGYPKVVVTAPSKISNCSLFTLDLTSSTGAGGRAWSTVSITARSTTADVDAINFFFNSSYIMNPPSAIPIGLLKASNVYTIEITLCNFLGRCGSDTHRIEVARSAPPSVSIVGPRSRTMRRYQTLSVHASVFYDACLYKTSAEFLTLYKPTYEWTVLNTKSREVMPNMVSTSKSPNKFLLPAYSLAVGMSVEITVVIRNSLGVEAGRKSILVEVLPSTLNAVLSGGLEGAVEIGKSLVLNASESQDPDVLDESESSGRIHYHWSCVSLVPGSEFVPCGSSVFNYSEPSSVNAALASVRPPFITAINTLFYITLTVTDSSGLRSDETTIKITTVSSGVPIVSVSPIVGVVNPATKLKVLASITSTFSGLAQWLVNDESINTLKVSTTSPTRYSIPNEAVNFPSNLAISANSLSGNVAYIFKLSFTYGSGDTTSSTIRVLTNSPPRPGSFSVSPSVGTELKDNFVFTASLWSDVDLPLTYRFGYLTPENTIHVVGSKSEEASATTILPRGSDTKDNELKCSLQTYDSLDSYSTGEYSVTVNPSMVPISVDNVSNTFETLIMLDDVDALENAISVYASVSSAVVCASAPNCTQLNRQACSTTAHTCGPCVSDEFIGVYGHHNSMCVVDQDVHEGDICSTDESCLPFMECQQEICVPVSKQCVNSCSDKGTCKYVVTALGLEVDSCLLSEPSCSAICVCDPGYYGADCSIDEVEMAYKTGLQETILCALQTLSQLQDATLSAIQSWIAVLRTLSIDPTKLSSRGSDCAVSAIHVILDSASDVDISVEGLEAVLNAIDAVSRFQDFYDFPVLTTEYKTDIITSLSNMLEKFCGVISSDMILGEYTFQSLKSKIRISAILVDSSDNFTLSIPQTSAELLASKETSYVSSIAPSTSGYCLVSFDAAMYDTLTPGLSANPLSIISASSETSRTNSSSILNISLQNIVPVDYGVVFNESVIEAVCTKDKFQTSEVYHCPDGSNYTFVCENVTGIFEIHCPKTTLVPVCNRVVGVDVVDSSCVVDIASSSLTSVNCICPSGAANSGSPPSSGGSEYVNAQFVAMTEFVLDDFVTTWRSAGDLTVGDVTRSWKVVVTLGFIACFGCCGVFYSDKADDEVSKKEEIKKNAAQNIHGRAARPSNAPPTKDKVEIVESIFPAIFRNEPFVSVFIRELKQSHRWVSLVYHYTPEFPRVLRALSLVCAVISTMFFNALLYNLVNPDDGSCKGIDNKNECLEERSPFSSHESKCYFDSEASTCHFREPSDSTQAIFIVAVVCAMLSLPLVVVLEIVIIEILAKPTENSNESAVVPINSDVSRHQGTQGVQAPKRMAMFSNKFRNNQVGVKNSEDKISKRATIAGGLGVSPRDELIDMISKIDKYRASLSPKQLREFDMAWGIDVSMAKELLQMDDVPVSTTGRMRSLMAANKSVMGPLLSDIRSVRETVAKEIQTMSMLSDEARGRRILFLFQQDLLLGAKGKIVERKGIGNGSGQVKTVSAYVKFMGWAFIILFNMALLFYVFLFALNQSENRQNAWLQSFLLWLFFEVVIVSTACMVISQMIIPSLIFSEVSRIKRNVVYAIENYKAKLVNQDPKEPSKDDDGQFNACDYLFVSTRVARGFPHLFESGVVMGFRTPLPKRTYRRDKSTANTYRGKLRVTAFINSMSVLLLFMFGLLMNLPAPMEQMFFSLVNWSLFGYIGLLHVVLFETSPGYVVVPLLIAIAIFGPIVYYNYRAIDRAHRLQAEQIEGKWYQDRRLSRCRPPFVTLSECGPAGGNGKLLRSVSDAEREMSPVAADTDEFNFEEQRARDIVIAMQKMVGEHDTGFGQLSGDEYDNDAQERRKQPKLRAILKSLGMMDRLRDLDLSDDDKDERKEGTLSSDNKVTLENSDLDSQSIHSLERFSSEEDIDIKRRHRPEEEIVGYMGHMVQEGQALFGATSDDFDNDETQESTKLAALLKKKGMMDKLFELSSSGEDDGEEAKQHREHRRTYRAARMTRLGRHMDKKSVVGDSSIQGPSLAATMGARKVIRNFRQRRQKGRPESEVVGYMKRMVRENEVELGEVLGEFTDKLDRAESDRQGLHLASKLRTNGMLEKLYDLSSTSSDGSDSSEAPELETNAVSRGEDRSLPNVHRPEDEDVSYMKRMVIEHDVTLGALSGEEDEQSGGAATPRKLPKLAAKLKADGMMDKLFELSSSSGEEVEGRSAGANRAERRRLRKATRLAKNNSKFPSSKDKESLLRESAVYSASGSKVGMIQALDQAPSSISGDDSDVAITIREPDNHQWGGQRVVGVDGGPLIINTLERIGEGSAEEGYGEFTGIPDSNNTIDVDSEATSESSSHNSEINNEVTCTSEVKPNNKLRSQKSIDRDDVVAAKKKFAMGLAGKDVSMKFRESDARSRLEQRLQNKKGKNANTAENLSTETRGASMTSKDLVKKLTVNTTRHRMSMTTRHDAAKLRLQDRLNDRKREVNMK